MRLQDILALVSAGYTRAEIERLEAGENVAPASSNKVSASQSAATKPVRRRARRGGKGTKGAPASALAIKASDPAPNARGVDYSAALTSLRESHGALFHASDMPGRLGGVSGTSLRRALQALAKGENLVYLARKGGQTREAVTVTASIAALLRREATLRKQAGSTFYDKVLGL